MSTIQHTAREGSESGRKKRTVDRAASQRASLAMTKSRLGRSIESRRYPTTWRRAPPSARLSHASSQDSTRGVPDVKRALPASEHVQRGDSTECDAHVRSAGFATKRPDEPPTPTHGHAQDRRAVRLQWMPVRLAIHSKCARQTCRLYHDLGVGCGCRRA
jgi:hypothetical protein